MSDDGRLIRMANQIAAELENGPRGEAVGATANHIRSFWDPRMRQKLDAIVDAGGTGLSETALAAARSMRAKPASAEGDPTRGV